MKKTLLSIGAALLFGFGAMAQITFTNSYQEGSVATVQTKIAQTFTPVAEEVYKVTISGKFNRAVTQLQAAFVFDGAANGWYCEASEWTQFAGSFAANETFSVSVNISIKSNTCLTDKGDFKLAINATNTAEFTTAPTGCNAEGTSCGTATETLILTGTATAAKQIVPEGTILNKNAEGKNQLNKKETLPTAFAKDDKFTVTITGTASANVSAFQVVAVNENDDVDNWSEMSEYIDLLGEGESISAGTPFSISNVLEITQNVPAAINEKARTLALLADSEAEMLGIKDLEIIVTPYEEGTEPGPGTAVPTVEAAKVAVTSSAIAISSDKTVSNVVVTNVAGVQVVNQAVGATSATVSTADLQAGVYYAVINFANGSVQVVKFVK